MLVPISHDMHATVTHEALAEAYPGWINRHYPNARNIGDVVLAMRSGQAPDLSFETAAKEAKIAAEDAALQVELANFEPLLEAPRGGPARSSKPEETKQRIFKGHRPAPVTVMVKGDKL